MVMLSDALGQLSDEDTRRLFEHVLESCRLQFPVIDLLAVHRPNSEESSIFDNVPLLVTAAVVDSIQRDRGVNDPDFMLSEVEPDEVVLSFHESLFVYIAWLCRGHLRKKVPARLRELDSDGRWAGPIDEVWYGVGQLMVDPDLRGPDSLRTFLAALQAIRFADAKDLEMWDLTAALIQLGDEAYSVSGKSLNRTAIVDLLNGDAIFQPPFEREAWSADDVERVYARIDTFRKQCIKAADTSLLLQSRRSR